MVNFNVNNAVIAVDFDGTVVTHEYPNVGKNIGAIPVLKALVEKGCKIILYTMRCGKELEEAVEWFKKHQIPLYGINDNPSQHSWTSSPKVFAHLYIDDMAVGVATKRYKDKKYIDWYHILYLLHTKDNFFTPKEYLTICGQISEDIQI